MRGKDHHKGSFLKPEDRLLWEKVTADVRPLPAAVQSVSGYAMADKPGKSSDEDSFDAFMTRTQLVFISVPELSSSLGKQKKQLKILKKDTAINVALPMMSRKMQRRVARQRFDASAKLDLHGFRQDEAYDLLLHFIQMNVARQQTCVLIITGKGRSAGKTGILRQLVPQWLATTPFRLYVGAVEVAARYHGGDGAFYVRLRNTHFINREKA